jgi:hypothetical protein
MYPHAALIAYGLIAIGGYLLGRGLLHWCQFLIVETFMVVVIGILIDSIVISSIGIVATAASMICSGIYLINSARLLSR